MLLPNTTEVLAAIERWNRRFNDWLSEQFGISLFLAHGYTPCSGNELVDFPLDATGSGPDLAALDKFFETYGWTGRRAHTQAELRAVQDLRPRLRALISAALAPEAGTSRGSGSRVHTDGAIV